MKTEKDIIDLIKNDSYMTNVLEAAEKLNLDDYWVCAGFIRNKIWDTLHNYSVRTPYNDVDIVYFNQTDLSTETETILEKKLGEMKPEIPWEVVNQARMYEHHPDVFARCAADGIAHFPETPTSIGIKLEQGKLIMTAPHGVTDLLNGIVNPTPLFKSNGYRDVYRDRVLTKNWNVIWPNLIINSGGQK